MKALLNDMVIAESNDTIDVEGNHYLPLAEKRIVMPRGTTPSLKQGAEAVADRVVCWKGVKVVA